MLFFLTNTELVQLNIDQIVFYSSEPSYVRGDHNSESEDLKVTKIKNSNMENKNNLFFIL